jgi:cell wall-active antibiotic response 4TMS protein YvqF
VDLKQYNNSSMVGGIILIVLGLIFFAVTQGAFSLDWGNIWPAFVMLGGLGILATAFATGNPAQRSGSMIGGTLVTLLGALFFATTFGVISWGLWPVYPLIVAAALLAGYFASARENSRLLVPAAVLGLIGIVFLGLDITGTGYRAIGQLWPIFVIIAGVLMLAQGARRPKLG